MTLGGEMTYEELEQDVLSYLENCSAGNMVELFNFIYNCEAEVEWDGNDNPSVKILENE